jgi:hypothetical protein
MTRGWWLWRPRGAPGKIRSGSALAALTMMLCGVVTLAAAPETKGLPDWPAQSRKQPPAPAPAPAQTESPEPHQAPAPAGGMFNPELPPSVNKSLEALAGQGVMGPVAVIELFIIAVLSLVLYLRRDAMDKALRARDKAHSQTLADRERVTDTARDEWLAELSQLQESRLALLERVMTVAGNATAVIQMHTASVNERTTSAEKMTETLRDFIAQATISRETFLRIGAELERQGRTNAEALTRISQGGGPS